MTVNYATGKITDECAYCPRTYQLDVGLESSLSETSALLDRVVDEHQATHRTAPAPTQTAENGAAR